MTGAGGRTRTLDGLRGIAVLAVVIEHGWPSVLPGGFAGVDVFFVLSGYLITGLLVRELRSTGGISLRGFYARRVRRIIPAALLATAGIWIGYTLLLGPAVPSGLRPQALSSTFSVSNIYFASQSTGYFDVDPSTSPYLHYWSLGVEEQFYLVWPSLLLALTVVARRLSPTGPANRWLPIGALAVMGVVSLALAMLGGETAAFYLLPHRGWELIAGGLLVWLQRDGLVRLPGRLARDAYRVAGVVAGATLVGIVFVAAPQLGRWPGPASILVVLGTLLLVAGGDEMPGARILAAPVLRFFGRISYALYLWHWPLISAAALLALPMTQTPTWLQLAAVIAAVGLATGSTFLIEEPIRASRRPLLSGGRVVGVALGAVAVVGLSVVAGTTALSQVVGGQSVLAADLPGARTDRERLITDECRTHQPASSELSDCLYGAASAPDGSPIRGDPTGPVVVLFGDSHASMWFAAVNAWARDAGLTLVPLMKPGCVPVDASLASGGSEAVACDAWRLAAVARIEQLHPVVTLMGYSMGLRISVDGRTVNPRRTPGRWVRPAEATLERLTAAGPVLLLGDVPRPGFRVPSCLGVHRLHPAACAKRLAAVDPSAVVEAQAEAAAATGAAFFNPGPYLCPDGVCTWLVDGHVGWADRQHITTSAAMAVLPELARALDSALGLPPGTG